MPTIDSRESETVRVCSQIERGRGKRKEEEERQRKVIYINFCVEEDCSTEAAGASKEKRM